MKLIKNGVYKLHIYSLLIVFFLLLTGNHTFAYKDNSSKIIVALSYPTSAKDINKAISLVTENKVKGIYFKGNWSANQIRQINNNLSQTAKVSYEVWANVPSVQHDFLRTPIEFPNEVTLATIDSTEFLKTLFTETSKYLLTIGVHKVIWPHTNTESKMKPYFTNASVTYLTQHIGIPENGIYTFAQNNTRLEPLEGDWKQWLQADENKENTLVLPLNTILGENPSEEQLNIQDVLINQTSSFPQPSQKLLESALKIYQQSIHIIKNNDGLIPIRDLHNNQFTAVYLGLGEITFTSEILDKYVHFEHHEYNRGTSVKDFEKLLAQLQRPENILVATINASSLSEEDVTKLSKLLLSWKAKTKAKLIIQLLAASDEKLKQLAEVSDALVSTPQSNHWLEGLLPQVSFGGILPNENRNFKNKGRFGFTLPEQVGLSSAKLSEIDSIAMLAINGDATPGCQVLVAKDGKVIFMKSYGHHSYAKQDKVTENSLYDIASVTKVLATLPSLMYLTQTKKLSLEKKLEDYLPEVKGSNKGPMVIKDILTHQAGLMSFIPHWYQLMEDSDFDTTMVAFEQSEAFPTEVVPGLYAVRDIEDKVFDWTIDSRLTIRSKRGGMHLYFYSDLGFYIFHRLIEKLNGEPLEVFTDNYFYKRLGLQTMTYLPLKKFERSRIAPTEMDIYFRKSLVHGTVHDPGAAMKGGVSGHAGLFSNALDIGVMMQMFLQEGWYGNEKYLEADVINEFNTQPYAYNQNRRALGWDKPLLEGNGGATSKYCSQSTFGHTGFTGTSTWVDPKHNLVYVFLSNRIHPFAGNTKLIRDNTRKKIHDIIYESMIDFKEQ